MAIVLQPCYMEWQLTKRYFHCGGCIILNSAVGTMLVWSMLLFSAAAAYAVGNEPATLLPDSNTAKFRTDSSLRFSRTRVSGLKLLKDRRWEPRDIELNGL